MAWLSGYGGGAGYRKPYTVDHTVVTDTLLSNFSKRIVVTFPDTHCDVNGDSLRVTSSNGTTLLDFGIISKSTSGSVRTFELRVNLSVNNSADVVVYIYCKTSGTNGENKAGAVDSNTKAYFPLEEDPTGSVLNWVGSSNGTSFGSMTSGDLVAGKVGNGLDFDGFDDEIYISDPFFTTNVSLTISCNVYIPSSSPASGCFLKVGNNVSGFGIGIGSSSFDTSGTNILALYEVKRWINTGNTFTTGWHHWAFRVDSGGFASMRQDGIGIYTEGAGNAPNTPLATTEIGGYTSSTPSNRHAAGKVDEVFISETMRSDTWLDYEYLDSFSYSSTGTLGSEEVSSPIYRVASTSGAVGATSAIDTTGANLIVLAITTSSPGGTPTDSKSNTWTKLTTRHTFSDTDIWYCSNPTVGSGHTFTATGNFNSIEVAAYAGVATSSPFDVENGATSANQPGSVTPSQGYSLVIAVHGGIWFTYSGVDSGFVTVGHQPYNPGTSMGTALAEDIQGATAHATNPTFSTDAGTSNVSSLIAVFKPASGSSTVNVTTTSNSVVVVGSALLTNTREVTTTESSTVVFGNVQPTNTREVISTNASSVVFGTALLTNTRRFDSTATSSVVFGSALATNTRRIDTTFSNVVTFGSASSTGNKQLDAVLASSVVFGSALITNTREVATSQSAAVAFGSALATNTRRVDSTLSNTVTFGAVSTTGNKQLDSILSTSVVFGSANIDNTRSLTATNSSSVVFGRANLVNSVLVIYPLFEPLEPEFAFEHSIDIDS